MKKNIFIVLLIIMSLIISECILFAREYYHEKEMDKQFGGDGSCKLSYSSILEDEDYIYKTWFEGERKRSAKQYGKGSIALFGCSYVYGTNLEYEETLYYKLGMVTKRTVYNFGIPAGGVQHMYDLLYRKNILKEIDSPPLEYAFYLLEPHLHYERLHLYTYMLFDKYLNLEYVYDKNHNFKLKKRLLPKGINGLYIVRYLNRYLDIKNMQNKRFEYNNEILLLIKESERKLKETYPNIKFVVLYMESDNPPQEIKDERMKLVENIKKYGIDVVDFENLTGIEYWNSPYWESEKDSHPRGEYWDVVIPRLVKKYNL